MPKEALLIVDVSNDFIHDKGGLSVGKPGQDIVPRIIDLATAMIGRGGLVVFCNDEHPGGVDHDWPKHNEPGTWGCELYGDLGKFRDAHRDVLYVPKTSYNAFWLTCLANVLKARDVETVVITGVCTDICILQTAAGAFDNNFKIVVPEHPNALFYVKGGVATFSPYGDATLEMMKIAFKAEITK